MKKILLILFVCLLPFATSFASINGFKIKVNDNFSVGLFMIFSGVDSSVEDENVKVEIYNGSIWVTNKSDKTIYVSLDESCVVLNETVWPLYKSDNRKQVVKEDQFFTVAPNTKKEIDSNNILEAFTGVYSAVQEKNTRELTKTFPMAGTI